MSQRVYTFDANGNRKTETYTLDAAGNRKTKVVKNLADMVLADKGYGYNNREQLLPVADGAKRHHSRKQSSPTSTYVASAIGF